MSGTGYLSMRAVGAAALGTVLLALTAPSVAAPVDQQPTYAESPGNDWYVPDGIVRTMTSTGGVLVIGGEFTAVRNRSTGQTVQRHRIAAFDQSTGDLLPTFSHGANDVVWSLTSDGSTVWAGGDFTSIGGANRVRLAALDANTGDVRPGFDASAAGRVFGLDNAGGTVYVGGNFGRLSGQVVPRLAALDGATGQLRAGWSGSANAKVRSVAVVPGTGTLAVGGNFTSLSGRARSFAGSVRLSDGAATGFAPGQLCAECWLLDVTATSTTMYGATAGPGGRAVAWNLATGAQRWVQRGNGDVQVVELVGDTVYLGGHFTRDNRSQLNRHMLAAVDAAGGRLRGWAPDVTGALGVWTLWGDQRGLWAGGSFREVDRVERRARLALFRTTSLS